MKIRPATVADSIPIAKVHVASWQGAYRGLIPDDLLANLNVERRAQMWNNILSQGDIDTFVALDDCGKVVGFATLETSRDDDAGKDVGEISTIYVTPEMWGKGYGRALMGEVLDKAKGRGFGCLTLWVLEANRRARRFYEAAGFAPDGAVKTETIRPDTALHEVRYRRDMTSE